MADQNIYSRFSLADIEKYLQGRMSAKEMHDLEKAALQDPFLADAMEGYAQASIPQAQAHLNQVAAALQGSREQAPVVPLPHRLHRWRKIAAAAAVVAAAALAGGLWWPSSLRQPAATELARNRQQVQETPTVDSLRPTPVPGQAAPKKNTASPKPLSPQSNPLLVALDRKRAVEKALPETAAAAVPAKEEPATADNGLTAATTANPAVARLTAQPQGFTQRSMPKGASPAMSTFTIRGTVLDNEQQPVPNASVKPVNGKSVALTDEEGHFTLQSMDSSAHVQIISIGHSDTIVLVNSNRHNEVQLETTESSLADLVITEIRSRKKTDSSLPKTEVYPAGGWQSFRTYVYQQLHQALDTSSGTLSGNIELEFLVNENGLPYQFKVLHSDNETLNTKAIEAIRNGPRWISGGGNRKNKVVVHF